MLPLVSARQLKSLHAQSLSPRWYIDEQLWSFLIATLIAEAPTRQIPLFCGEALPFSAECGIACEAEPTRQRRSVSYFLKTSRRNQSRTYGLPKPRLIQATDQPSA